MRYSAPFGIKLALSATLALGANAATPEYATPISPETWIGAGDYPPSSLYHNEQGTVGFTITVDRQGGVKDCRITQSSGYQALDVVTCEILQRRARFTPPASGAAQYSNRTRWQQPVQGTSQSNSNPVTGVAGGAKCLVHETRRSLNSSQVVASNRCSVPILINTCARIQDRIGTITQGQRVEPGSTFVFDYVNPTNALMRYNIADCPPGNTLRKDLCVPKCPAEIKAAVPESKPPVPKIAAPATPRPVTPAKPSTSAKVPNTSAALRPAPKVASSNYTNEPSRQCISIKTENRGDRSQIGHTSWYMRNTCSYPIVISYCLLPGRALQNARANDGTPIYQFKECPDRDSDEWIYTVAAGVEDQLGGGPFTVGGYPVGLVLRSCAESSYIARKCIPSGRERWREMGSPADAESLK